jgi:predicted ATPase/class 3 adenylate cyclase
MSDVTVRTTFLFTDVERSTAIWEAAPDAMSSALAHHDRVLRDAVEEAGGSVFKTVGDAFHAVFADPAAAVRAAIAGQRRLSGTRWPAGAELRVRMAVHTGTAVRRETDYFGPSVNRVARLLAIGHGGQVLVSSSTAALVADRLPPGAGLDDMGEHHLKDIAGVELVHQLSAPGLRRTFPALRSPPDPRRGRDLPEPVSSFIGRRQELAHLDAVVAAERLVSLVGPGGVGKTRLALELAARLGDRFEDGVRFVSLEALGDARAVPEVLAVAFDGESGPSPTAMAEALGGRSMLVVVDHCERVVDEVGAAVAAALARASRLHIVTTSRSPLHVDGEVVFRVGPMPVPRSADGDADVDAIELFATRARAHDPGLVLDGSTRSVAASICRRLDGLPLAIELAAGRLGSMSLAELEARVEVFTRAGHAASTARTLAGVVGESIDLLSAGERCLLERLTVFSGGWSLRAAEAVVALEDLAPGVIVDLQAALCDRSLVQITRSPTGTRYALLGTVRDVARGRLQLDRPDEIERLARHHAGAFFGVAAEARAHGRHRRLTRAERDALEPDRENLWSAADRCWADGHRSEAAVIALALDRLADGQDPRVETLLGDLAIEPSELAPDLAADCLLASARLVRFRRPPDHRQQLAAAATIARAHGDSPALALALAALADDELHRADTSGRALALADEAMGMAADGGEQAVIVRTLVVRAQARRRTGDRDGATADLRDALALAQALDDTASAGHILLALAETEHADQHTREATWLATDAVALSEDGGDASLGGWARSLLGVLAADHGDTASARRLHLAAFDLASLVGDRLLAAAAAFGLARACADEGALKQSSTLLGMGDALVDELTAHLRPPYAGDRERALNLATAGLGLMRMRLFADRGRILPLETVVTASEIVAGG